MSQKTRLARLKKHDPKRGYVLKRFTYRGVKFHVERGWVRVDEETAKYLEGVHQIPGNTHTPLAFDVCTDEEAKKLEEREEKEEERKKAEEGGSQLKARRD